MKVLFDFWLSNLLAVDYHSLNSYQLEREREREGGREGERERERERERGGGGGGGRERVLEVAKLPLNIGINSF